MTNQDTRAEFKKAVILALHPECESYEEALEKELIPGCEYIGGDGYRRKLRNKFTNRTLNPHLHKTIIGLPITIGRVMAALGDRLSIFKGFNDTDFNSDYFALYREGKELFRWQLTKDGKELTDDEQSDECISKLLSILKNSND